MTTVLATHALSIGYPRRVVADTIQLTLNAGEFVCLLGANGAGKSTLLRTLAGMQKALGGQVRLLGDDVSKLPARELAKRLSVVLTERVEVGVLSGYSLVALGRHPYTDWTGALSAEDEKVIHWAVQAVGAVDLAPRPVHSLSDGERQKLMIARALAQEPALMMLDEPTAFLDLPRRVEIMQMLKTLAHTTGRCILLSIHDLDLALRHADKICLMSKGAPLQIGTPEDLVLSGAFEATFASEGVEFDPYTGTFKLKQAESRPQVTVQGEGLRAIWLSRALERAGYAIQADCPIVLEVTEEAFLLHQTGKTESYPTIEALLAALG